MLKMLDVLEASFGKGYSRNIQQALSYIRTNYAKQISLMEIAAHVGLSPEYFSRLFKEETGENFSVHLMMYRLNQAQRLLRQTDLKVYEIASAVGYATPSYFSKLYRTYMGELPESARRRNS
jgi:YesN/AraC family two-component response regulator